MGAREDLETERRHLSEAELRSQREAAKEAERSMDLLTPRAPGGRGKR